MSYPPQHIIAARCTVTAAATAVPAAVVAEAAYSTLLSLQPLLDCSRRLSTSTCCSNNGYCAQIASRRLVRLRLLSHATPLTL